jgi:hypothetical protein
MDRVKVAGEILRIAKMLTAAYTVTVTKTGSGYDQTADEVIVSRSFDGKDDAEKFMGDMIRKYKLKRQRGFWGNTKTGIEMDTNF